MGERISHSSLIALQLCKAQMPQLSLPGSRYSGLLRSSTKWITCLAWREGSIFSQPDCLFHMPGRSFARQSLHPKSFKDISNPRRICADDLVFLIVYSYESDRGNLAKLMAHEYYITSTSYRIGLVPEFN
ncbi:uncharacterized protein MYCFIDRAFT_178847 [Pseudocercospora fijiensis CIRAD86]|uniref:Uncharacterized protein n=1 Tax=Pseudocercospora fijiensis (strain CIRAD86) TaxID=383855 RepID=M2ZI11_PSEFD|nr:uncharacterized protein MYCFIDRAFT_178847 [Pseudocercospora fijiensis CIRAD86]EME78739.1 hypothetical protein MYCFIDRAFT_178847 [Pseudocercospora fijiensis CIRAD86]